MKILNIYYEMKIKIKFSEIYQVLKNKNDKKIKTSKRFFDKNAKDEFVNDNKYVIEAYIIVSKL